MKPSQRVNREWKWIDDVEFIIYTFYTPFAFCSNAVYIGITFFCELIDPS